MFEIGVYEANMKKALEYMLQEFSGLQTGRATSGLVDHVVVNA